MRLALQLFQIEGAKIDDFRKGVKIRFDEQIGSHLKTGFLEAVGVQVDGLGVAPKRNARTNPHEQLVDLSRFYRVEYNLVVILRKFDSFDAERGLIVIDDFHALFGRLILVGREEDSRVRNELDGRLHHGLELDRDLGLVRIIEANHSGCLRFPIGLGSVPLELDLPLPSGGDVRPKPSRYSRLTEINSIDPQ